MDESHKSNAESQTQEYILHDSFYTKQKKPMYAVRSEDSSYSKWQGERADNWKGA